MNWDDYLIHFTNKGRHIVFSRWTASGIWEFTRSDGLLTAHHMESPFVSKKSTCEESMRLADKFIPLDSELPEGMMTRHDPNYGPLWGKQ